MEGCFLECHFDDSEMELMDGTRWLINPGDLSIVSCWTPTTKVRIDYEKSNRPFKYKVINLTDNSVAYVTKA